MPSLCLYPFFFFFYCSGDPGDLHSFPTRRSSDLDFGRDVEHLPAAKRRIDERAVADAGGAALKDEIRGRNSDRKSTRLNSSHVEISYAVFCLKKKKKK